MAVAFDEVVFCSGAGCRDGRGDTGRTSPTTSTSVSPNTLISLAASRNVFTGFFSAAVS
jgi:hypothetical protein